jgi:carbamoyl-phosphate synthase large subunit
MVRKKRVLLTGIGGNTAQGVAKSLLKFPDEFSIIGSDSDKYNIRFGFNYVRRVYLVPSAKDEDYIYTISKIIRRERIDLIIPSPDPEVYELSKHKKELDAEVFLPDHKIIEITQDKWSTYEALKGKVVQPKAFLIKDHGDLERSFSEIKKPLWLRKRKGVGGSKSFIAYSLGQAKFWIEYWEGYGEFIASEVLQGRNLSWIGLYKDGELITSGGYQRLRYFMERISPTGVTGNINVGMTIHDDELNYAAERAVQAIDNKPNGVYTVDVKENGGLNVTELNSGRFHMSFYVYTEAGLNLPYYYVKLALDEPVELPAKRNALKAGIMTIRNTDNEPIIISADELDKDLIIP